MVCFVTNKIQSTLLIMDKIKLLTFSVVVLLLLNIGTLSFLLLNGPKHRPDFDHKRPQEIIIERLHLDQKQQKDYQKLIHWHRGTIDNLDDQIRNTKNRLYLQLLKTNVDVAAKDSLIAVLAATQKQIEETHFQHFQDIKKLCKPEQLEDYYDLTQELSRIFSKPPRPRHD